jgi:pimeloyl-ACP methyl ester carboxylesterase
MVVSGLRDHLGLGVSGVGAAGLTLVFCEVKCRSGLGFGLQRLAEEFHIIAPDARGSAMTTHSGGPVSMSMLADDVAGLIDALGLDRPAVAGFSEGGLTALLLGIRHPDSIRALVCDSGYDLLNPDAPAFAMLPALLGGLPQVDPDVVEQSFGQDPEMAEVFALMKADQDAARGEGYWRTYVGRTLERWSHWPGYGYADLAKITVPTLILVGDRDHLCSVEEAAVAFRNLGHGQLAVIPNPRARDQHRQGRGTSQLPGQLDRATPGKEHTSRTTRPAPAASGAGPIRRPSRNVGSARTGSRT